jgi:hypothetical protein
MQLWLRSQSAFNTFLLSNSADLFPLHVQPISNILVCPSEKHWLELKGVLKHIWSKVFAQKISHLFEISSFINKCEHLYNIESKTYLFKKRCLLYYWYLFELSLDLNKSYIRYCVFICWKWFIQELQLFWKEFSFFI